MSLLILKPTRALPRTLRIELRGATRPDILVSMMVGQHGSRLNFSYDEIERSYLSMDGDAPCLWVDRSAFELTQAEAAQIREAYEARGLHVKLPEDLRLVASARASTQGGL